MERVFLIHGWSVTTTETYQALHHKLADNGYELKHIYLGRYVSLDNEVEIRDVARAMHQELERHLKDDWASPFHLITHSTGALIVKQWIVHNYTGKFAEKKPLGSVIFLAGPHFGSRLAHQGRSMLAHIRYLGDTGKKLLTALELGSEFSWEINGEWLNSDHWQKKGVRPFNLIGDRVVKRTTDYEEKWLGGRIVRMAKDQMFSKLVPAHYEAGSDMTVRVAAGNLNFRRYQFTAKSATADQSAGRWVKLGEISGVPFGSLWRYTHSGPDFGIMNSIKRGAKIQMPKYQNLKLILECLQVKSDDQYAEVRDKLAEATVETLKKRTAYAQIDFRFVDDSGEPIDDYSFTFGAIKNDEFVPSKTVAHTHKNRASPNHFTVYIDLDQLEPQLTYYMLFDTSLDTPLVYYRPKPLEIQVTGVKLTDIVSANQTTQIEVVLARKSHPNLFVFHPGGDPQLHLKWNRKGEVK